MGRSKKVLAVSKKELQSLNPVRNGINMQITKVVSKKVTNPVSGEKVNRKANITLTVPDFEIVRDAEGKATGIKGLSIPNAIQAFGSSDRLIGYALVGLWNHIRTNESNDLARADKASRGLKKAVNAMKAVMPNLSEDALRAMFMSNPEYADSFKTAEFSLVVDKTIDVLERNADGSFKYDPPILESSAKDEDEESEEESE